MTERLCSGNPAAPQAAPPAPATPAARDWECIGDYRPAGRSSRAHFSAQQDPVRLLDGRATLKRRSRRPPGGPASTGDSPRTRLGVRRQLQACRAKQLGASISTTGPCEAPRRKSDSTDEEYD
jgi:hypothetical protein